MAQVVVKLQFQSWRLLAVQIAIWVLITTEFLFPGSVDEDAATEKMTAFILRGLKVAG